MLSGFPYDVINGVPLTKFNGLNGSNIYLVHTLHEWKYFFEYMMKKRLVACDTETSGLRYFKEGQHIVGMSFGWADEHFYVPVRHEASVLFPVLCDQICMDDIREDLKTFFSREDLTTIWHNAKFDFHFYLKEGIEIKTPFHDTLLLWTLFDENAPYALKVIASGWTDIMGQKHAGIVCPTANDHEKALDKFRSDEAKARRKALNDLVAEKATEIAKDPAYQGIKRVSLKKIVREQFFNTHPFYEADKESVHYGYIPVKMMCEYAATDTYITYKIYEHVLRNLEFTGKRKELYFNELALTRVLVDTEEGGTCINVPYLHDLRDTLTKEVEDKLRKLEEVLGSHVNISSTKQLAAALRENDVTLTKVNEETGNVVLDKKVLTKLAKEHDIVKDILEFRKADKLKSTYTDSILEKLVDGNVLHCTFNQNVRTGRMSSVDPNLQNLPANDDRIRRAFVVPNDEYVFVFCDYSQIEVRLTAHYSQDPLLLDAYAKGQDVHTRTLCEMFGFVYETVEEVLEKQDKTDPRYKLYKSLRNVAKRINFGIIYGVGAPGLSEQIERPDQYLHLSEEGWVNQCQIFIDNYLSKYLGVKRFINSGTRDVKKNGYVTNHFGRDRHLPHVYATKILNDKSKFWMEAKAHRQAVNFLIQGTAADLFKIAAVRVHKILKGTKSRIVNFVHDEIQIYLHKSELHLLSQIKQAMEDFDFTVPIIADMEYSLTNWAEKKEIH